MLRVIYQTEVSGSCDKGEAQILANELAISLGQSKGIKNPFEAKQHLWSLMMKFGVGIPSDVFENLETDDSIECWSEDLKLIFAMGDILKYTSYTYEELMKDHWSLLFTREEKYMRQALEAYNVMVTTSQPVFDVTDWHMVTELKTDEKLSFQVKIKCMCPFVSRTGLRGFFAIVKARPLSQ